MKEKIDSIATILGRILGGLLGQGALLWFCYTYGVIVLFPSLPSLPFWPFVLAYDFIERGLTYLFGTLKKGN